MLAGSPCRSWAYRDNQWSRVAALVPVVKACAAGGDGEALKVLREGIAELALSVKAVAAALQFGGTGEVKGRPVSESAPQFLSHWMWLGGKARRHVSIYSV